MEMKIEEPSSPSHDGDISPINHSVLNFADENKPSSSSAKPVRKTEPAFESRPNFSRVTPAQVVHISFPSEGRYQPVRPVSANPGPTRNGKAESTPAWSIGVASEKYAGGGGILILADLRPEEEGEFIEFEPPVQPAPAEPVASVGNGHAISAPPSGPHIALDESAPEASPPEPFEVCQHVWFYHDYRI